MLSNIAVAKVILDPRLPIRPRLLRVRVSQKSDIAKVIYANSITLTPGTVTLDVRNGEFLDLRVTAEVPVDLEREQIRAHHQRRR